MMEMEFHRLFSSTVGGKMKFGIYVPTKAEKERVPLLIYLSGLTCNEQNFITKSGVQRLASEYGFIVANPDTSPRKREKRKKNFFDLSIEICRWL